VTCFLWNREPFPVRDRVRYPLWRAIKYSGATEAQIRYWDQIGLVQPSIRKAGGPGHPRLFSADDLRRLRAIAKRLHEGESLQRIHAEHDEAQKAMVGATA
jgi:DNA-binding transcriptional MerR regulator